MLRRRPRQQTHPLQIDYPLTAIAGSAEHQQRATPAATRHGPTMSSGQITRRMPRPFPPGTPPAIHRHPLGHRNPTPLSLGRVTSSQRRRRPRPARMHSTMPPIDEFAAAVAAAELRGTSHQHTSLDVEIYPRAEPLRSRRPHFPQTPAVLQRGRGGGSGPAVSGPAQHLRPRGLPLRVNTLRRFRPSPERRVPRGVGGVWEGPPSCASGFASPGVAVASG